MTDRQLWINHRVTVRGKDVEKVLHDQIGRGDERHEGRETEKTDEHHAISHFQASQEEEEHRYDADEADKYFVAHYAPSFASPASPPRRTSIKSYRIVML